ncbi:MAG: PAS domain S-box protein [Aeromicrobium sp.]|nr:PAS domain S-box protein [Burkholderiales bacterium]
MDPGLASTKPSTDAAQPAPLTLRSLSDTVDGSVELLRQEALLKTGALQDAIFKSAHFACIATDEKGVIQIFNVGAERMLGYAACDVVNLITPADISDPAELIARAATLSTEFGMPITPGFEALVFKATRGIEDIYDLTQIRKDGSCFSALVSVTGLRDARNDVIGYLLISTDNTARKQVEAEQRKLDQQLRDQQFYTRSLIESNIDALMTTDPAGIITDVNKQMEALTGCTRDELIGAPFKGCFTDPVRAEAGIKRVLVEKKVTDYELTARAPDGRQTVVSYNATTFHDRQRNLKGVFAAARDVTEQKRLHQALQETNAELQNAKYVAEKANLAKSDFLSSMSHELRSPLNAILGFAQLLDAADPPPTAGQKASVGQILHAGWYLLELINEILDLSVVESGRLSLSPEPVSLSEVMLECREMMQPQADARNITLAFPALTVQTFVRADRTRLKQVLVNLLSNGIKYNNDHGNVSVTISSRPDGFIRTRVIDTGSGLSAEKIAQLFQLFNRLGHEGGAVEGTGIGLVMSKRLVELMGGTVGVESRVGSGSEFWFDLAADDAPPPMTASIRFSGNEIRIPVAESAVRTILYVEDNPANLALVEQIIARRADLRLITAVNGRDGVALAQKERPDVILMDINLPGMSGTGALRALKADSLTAGIPVLALSANAMPRDIKNGLEAGFVRYLTKPIKIDALIQALDAALQPP